MGGRNVTGNFFYTQFHQLKLKEMHKGMQTRGPRAVLGAGSRCGPSRPPEVSKLIALADVHPAQNQINTITCKLQLGGKITLKRMEYWK